MATTIRTILFERDADTDTRAVLDIREFDAPAPIPGRHSLTAASKDAVRRALLADLSRQVDALISGEVHEIHMFLNDQA